MDRMEQGRQLYILKLSKNDLKLLMFSRSSLTDDDYNLHTYLRLGKHPKILDEIPSLTSGTFPVFILGFS